MAAKNQGEQEIEVKHLSLLEITKGIGKLTKRVSEVNKLVDEKVGYNDPKVSSLESSIRSSILDIFGQKSLEYREHQYFEIWDGGYNYRDSESVKQEKFENGLKRSIVILDGLISRLNEKKSDSEVVEEMKDEEEIAATATNRVFIVHGHDEAIKQEVARFVEKVKLVPVILGEQANVGNTIIEKFESHSDVGYAIVLLTPDDLGRSKKGEKELASRARQNVILELGYFIGKLGRNKVCAIHCGGIELPSDFIGVLYTPYDEGGGWKLKLAKEIKEAGLTVDLNDAI